MIVEKGKYYVYSHFRQDKMETFYVGVGTKRDKDLNNPSIRTTYGRAFTKHGRIRHWYNIVELNPNYEVKILFEFDNEDEMFEKEIFLISFYGRRDLKNGRLVNVTPGGRGQPGYRQTEKHLLAVKRAQIGRIKTSEEIKKIADGNRGKKVSEEAKSKRLNTWAKDWGVTVLDLNGKLVKNYKNAQEAATDLNILKQTIIGFISGKIKTSKAPYIFVKTSEYDENIIYKNKEYFSNWVSIFQYSLDGEFIKEWETATIAGRELRINNKNIATVAKGKRSQAGGFKWRYKNFNLSYDGTKRIKEE